MRHFTHISHHYNTKNKLEHAVAKFLGTKDRLIIETKNRDSFKQEVIQGIEKLNAEYPRCKPLKVSWRKPHGNPNDLALEGTYSICQLYAYAEQMTEEVTADDQLKHLGAKL